MSAILVSCVLNFSVITLLPEDVRISVIIMDDVNICNQNTKNCVTTTDTESGWLPGKGKYV